MRRSGRKWEKDLGTGNILGARGQVANRRTDVWSPWHNFSHLRTISASCYSRFSCSLTNILGTVSNKTWIYVLPDIFNDQLHSQIIIKNGYGRNARPQVYPSYRIIGFQKYQRKQTEGYPINYHSIGHEQLWTVFVFLILLIRRAFAGFNGNPNRKNAKSVS